MREVRQTKCAPPLPGEGGEKEATLDGQAKLAPRPWQTKLNPFPNLGARLLCQFTTLGYTHDPRDKVLVFCEGTD